ncbi:MAG: putative Ig domain-containing protein, partial [Betaproteobacteria bacterium]|nr:putative Ig domain-containing protein [Betaproteobacteria bacterium]
MALQSGLAHRLAGGAFRAAAIALIAVSALLASTQTFAQSVANGAALWTSRACGGCHGTPPDTMRRNAANSRSVLDAAISNNVGAFMGFYRATAVDGGANGGDPLNASDRNDIVAYINSVFTADFTSAAVAYGGMITINLPNIATTSTAPASTVISSIGTVGIPTGGTVSYNQATPSATFTHTATNCSNASFSYRGSGISSALTSTRTVTVPVTAPAAPTVSGGPFTIAYSTGSTPLGITVGGSATSLVVGALSGGAGTLSAVGTTLSYTASSTTYAASQTFTLQAVGPCASSGTIMVTLNVNTPPAPVITSSNMASGTGGQAFSFNVTASNAPTSFAASGLPTGLSINTMTGAITGTPTVSGMFTAMVTATGPGGTSSAQSLSINIGLATPAITSTLTANATSGSPFTYNITASNLPASYNATGLPTGLMINTMTGAITGTPVVAMAGTVPVTISATNANGTGSATLNINVSLNAPTITSANTASGNVGSAFSFNVSGSDFPTSYAATGLPAGLSINTMTGAITGTPTAAGVSMVMVSATNGAGTGNQTLTITITLLPPAVTSAAAVSGTVTQALSYQITASNSPTSFAATGLPAGLSINTMTGLISGSPTSTGTSMVTVSATNAAGTGNLVVTFTISNFPPPVVNGATIQVPFGGTGTVDFFLLSGGTATTSYAITRAPLNGLVAVNGSVATYTPFTGFFGMDSFGVTAMGPGGASAQAIINVVVGAPGAPSVAARNVNVAYNTQTAINLSSAVTGVASTIAISTQPANGTVSANGLVATYKPNADYFGPDSFAYTATGPGGTSMPATVSITVGTLAPTAAAVSFAVPGNTATTMDLKPFINGSAITGVRVTLGPKFGKAFVDGTKVVYTPNTDYQGPDSFSYRAFGNAGTSPDAVVSVRVMGNLSDPRKSEVVRNLANTQADRALQNATTAINTVQVRQEVLRRGVEVSDANPPPVARAPAKTTASLVEGLTGNSADPRVRPVASGTAPAASPESKAAQGALAQAIATRGVDVAAVAQAASGGAVNQAPDRSIGAVNWWAAGTAQFGNRKQDGSFTGSEFTTSGLTFGVDKRFQRDLVAGIALGVMRDKTTLGTDGSNTKARAATLSLYGGYQPTPTTFVDGMLGYGRLNFSSQRTIAANGSVAESDRDGTQFFASVAGGYEKRDNG